MNPKPGPLIVTGMHRSGTSMTASMVAALGVDIGAELIPADRNNLRGYFEDAEFVRLQGRMLSAATPADDGGHRDWGWTESETLDDAALAQFIEPARALLETRARQTQGLWGWKDPRTSLLLDFWQPLTPDARYLVLYRLPWDVADSMQRLGAQVFLSRPDYAQRIWAFYYRRILDFVRRHRERVALVSTNALVREPHQLAAILKQRLGLRCGRHSPGQWPGAELDSFRTSAAGDPLGALSAAVWPECARLLRELDALADLSARGLWDAPHHRATRRPEETSGEVPLSVVVPTFNQGTLLVEAVASVERCAPGAELVIVNDGSTEPESLRILEVLRAEGYAVITQENRGLPAARNRGFAETHGEWVLPLDDDNRLLPGWLELAMTVSAGQPSLGVLHGNWREFGLRNGLKRPPPLDLDELLVRNTIDASALIRREAWSSVGGYEESLRCWEDWEFWIALRRRGWTFQHVASHAEQAAYEYRVRPGSMVTLTLDPQINRSHRERIAAKHAELYAERFARLLEDRNDLRRRLEYQASRSAASHASAAKRHRRTGFMPRLRGLLGRLIA